MDDSLRLRDSSPDFVAPSLIRRGLGGVLIFFIFCFRLSYAAEPPKSDQQASVIKSEDAIGKRVGEYRLTDQDGKGFSPSEFAGKPFVVSFVYTSCTYICGTITQSLSGVIKEKKDRAGKDFNFLTVSFDPERDTPKKLKEFGSNYTKDFAHWKFATADKETVERMAKEFGFFYKKEDGHFQHMNMVSIVGGDGNILAQVYGTEFRPAEVLNPIYYPERYGLNGEKKTISGLIKKVVLYCYRYDPSTNSYRLDYPLLVRMGLEGTLLFSILFFVWKKEIASFFSRRMRRAVL